EAPVPCSHRVDLEEHGVGAGAWEPARDGNRGAVAALGLGAVADRAATRAWAEHRHGLAAAVARDRVTDDHVDLLAAPAVEGAFPSLADAGDVLRLRGPVAPPGSHVDPPRLPPEAVAGGSRGDLHEGRGGARGGWVDRADGDRGAVAAL